MDVTRFSPKAVLFDLDGTLVEFHFEFLWSETERILAALEYEPVARPVMQDAFSDCDYFRIIADHNGDRSEFVKTFWQMWDWDRCPAPQALPFSKMLLEILARNGIPVAVVTARPVPAETISEQLRACGLLPYVDHVETHFAKEGQWSDKRLSMARSLEELGVRPFEAMMVGDTPHDILSAQKVGIGSTVALLSGGIRREILEKTSPDLLLESVGELARYLT